MNFISFTPGTSFDVTRGSGLAEERQLLYYLLIRAWNQRKDWEALLNLLQGTVKELKKFKEGVAKLQTGGETEPTHRPRKAKRGRPQEKISLEPKLTDCLIKTLKGEVELKEKFLEICDQFKESARGQDPEVRMARSKLIGSLRQVVARTCINFLEPDLVILDEFQRFRHLLAPSNSDESRSNSDAQDGKDSNEENQSVASLATALFDWQDQGSGAQARVLLLSATPYPAYTGSEEDDSGSSHHEEFLETARFLFHEDEGEVHKLREDLERFRQAVLDHVDRRGERVGRHDHFVSRSDIESIQRSE